MSLEAKKRICHKWNSEQAAIAGQKGGRKTSENREFMSQIGKIGGRVRAEQIKSAKIVVSDKTDVI